MIKIEDDPQEVDTPLLIKETSSYESLYDFISEEMIDETIILLKQEYESLNTKQLHIDIAHTQFSNSFLGISEIDENDETFATLIEKFEFAEQIFDAISVSVEMVEQQHTWLLMFENEKSLRGLDKESKIANYWMEKEVEELKENKKLFGDLPNLVKELESL